MKIPEVRHAFVDVDGVRVFYREAGPADALPVLLLHGFPAGSHQYRRLMDALGDRHRLIAPDYPGFGHTETPAGFTYTFDRLADVSLIAPDGWTLDQHFLDLPGRKQAQLALAENYGANVELYPVWQAWLREHRPRTLIIWGRNDAFFSEPGAHAYLSDLPDAELHVLDTGHFALEDKLPEIAPLIDRFLRADA